MNLFGYRFAKWKHDAEAYFESDSQMFEGLFNDVHKGMVCGILHPYIPSSVHTMKLKPSDPIGQR